MEAEIFCRVCGSEVNAEECALTYKRKVKGKELYFCCPHCMEEYGHKGTAR